VTARPLSPVAVPGVLLYATVETKGSTGVNAPEGTVMSMPTGDTIVTAMSIFGAEIYIRFLV